VITVQNTGTTDAFEVEVLDKLPEGLVYLSSTLDGIAFSPLATGEELKWAIADFPAGASVEIKLQVKILPLKEGSGGTVINTATVSSQGTELSPEDNRSSALVNVRGFFIPNVITPNGDGFNDSFEIKGMGRFMSNEIVIFNRFGDHLFGAKNYLKEWSAAGLIDDTYFYVLIAVDDQGKKHEFKGWVQVIRE
jgi:gliding motility-associated-like protein